MKEIIEMAQNLLEMRMDAYMMCKYTLLVVSRERGGMNHFVKTLFGLTDAHRPLCIEMKKGGVA